MHKKIAGILVLMIVLLLTGSRMFAASLPVRVAAAANLSGVMKELEAAFNDSNPGVALEVVFGSSGKLAAQIINGAPFDVFLSADMETPRKLADQNFAEHVVRYAGGRLIIFTTRTLPLEQGIRVAALPEVKRIAIANPELAPYGRAVVEALAHSGLSEAVKGKIVCAGNVSEAAHFTMTGADVGFTALALLQTTGMRKFDKKGKYWQEIDPRLYAPIEQGMAVVSGAGKKHGARIFYDFILSGTAREIFTKHGYR